MEFNMQKIQFITGDEISAKNFAIEPSKKIVPEWYKNTDKFILPETIDNIAGQNGNSFRTIKACMPVLDYLTSGYIIKTISHTRFINDNTEEYSSVKYATSELHSIETHPHKQCPIKIEGERKTYIKFNSPWIIKTPPGYSCYFYQPFFHMETRFTLMPAIVDTDKYDKTINFPGWINGKKEVEVEPGVPLIAVLPFKREEWKSELILDPDLAKKPSLFDRFLNEAYKKLYWKPKSYR